MNYDNINIEPQRQGMTVTPTQNPETGEYGEFQVSGNGILQNEYKFQDYQQNNDTVDPQAFVSEESIDDQLVNDFATANPDLYKAISYANQFMTEEQAEAWNNRVDNADWFDLAEELEQMLTQYRAAGSPDIEPNQYTEEPEITQEQVETEFNNLMESEPEGIETAGDFLNEAEQYMQQGDDLAAQMMMAASRFHSGAMTASEAIEAVTQSGYSEDQIIQTYYKVFND